MTYLVAANVISEPTKPVPSGKVVDWLSANEENLVVDSIILGELCIGILALPRSGLAIWDAAISRGWAKLVVNLKQKGDKLPLLDSMIAATALHHELTVATRNTRDFARAGVKVLDPFA